MKKAGERTGWILLLILLWVGLIRAGGFSPLIFPSPQDVLKALHEGFTQGNLGWQILISMGLVLSGLIAASVAAFLFFLISASSRTGQSLVETLTIIFHPLAGIALLPVVILWFGTGALSIIFIILHSALWPMVTNLTTGYQSLPETYRIVGRNYELSKWRMFTQIILPGSLPYILAGLKISWSRSWRALISAEMIFGAVFKTGGVGWYIFSRRVFMDTPGMFAGITVVIIIGILMEDLFFGVLEKNTVSKWGMTLES
ncbi:MAG: ABC transporter permease [Spirochaetes bacterium]|nr:MAG: ABC transporter permease [Spirochaetota bacterium]